MINEKRLLIYDTKKQSFCIFSTIAKKRRMFHSKVVICIMSLWTASSFKVKFRVIF
jgi:hypothetical protein